MTVSNENQRRGWQQFWLGFALYGVLIVGLNLLVSPLHLARPLIVILTFVPVLAAFWAMLGWLRAVRAMDEFQQRLVSESVNWSLALTGLVTFSYGLLESSADLPMLSMVWVWPLICATFGIGRTISHLRYR